MGRRKSFIPPLLINQPSDVNLASLSATAARRPGLAASSKVSIAHLSAAAARQRDELVAIVQEEENRGNEPSAVLFSDPAASSSSTSSKLPPKSISVPSMPIRSMQGFVNSQGGPSCNKRKSPHVTAPLFRSPLSRMLLSPRIRSPSVRQGTSPMAYVTDLRNDNQRIGAEHDSQQGGQMSNKRRSPHVTAPLFRSPLSRMLLSPRIRSPSVRQGTSPMAYVTDLRNDNQRIGAEQDSQQGGHMRNIDLNVRLEELDSSDDDDDVGVQGNHVIVRRNAHQEVTSEKARHIFDSLMAMARNGALEGHETREVAELYSVSMRTVQRIWDRGRKCLDQGEPVDVSNRKKGRCGRKPKECDVSVLASVPITERATMADAAQHLHVSKTKFATMHKDGKVKRVSNTLKPFLTDENKKARLRWCLRMLDPTSIPHDPMFQGLFDYIYIDEKWFNITRSTQRFYAVPNEQQPLRTSKHKNHIPRIMFLAAVARPRFDSNGNCTFDGKIGCFPLVKYVAAQRSSVNRPRGTIEMKPIDPVDKDVMREFMIEKILAAIHEKWPHEVGETIYIQQDNAKPHISASDSLFGEAAQQRGLDIKIVCQPANSPDLNILDLGFFNAIQSLQYKSASKTTEELVAAVEKAFDDYSPSKTNRIFLTLHSCLQEIMRERGGHHYNIPHIRKSMLERQDRLPLQLKCDATLVNEVMAQV